MVNSIFDKDGFILIECKKDNLLCEFILNKGFCRGVKNSENYHFHSSYEIHVPVRGNLHILIEEKDVFVKPGMVCVIPPNAVHYVFGDENSFRVSYRFNFSHTGGGERDYFSVFNNAYSNIKDVCVIENCDIYSRYLSVAADNLLNLKPDVMVSELLFLAGYEIAAAASGAYGEKDNAGNRCSHSLMAENIEEFFNNYYNKSICLKDLADYLNFSSRHTERIMQKLFGMSFNEMLNRKRLVTAQLLLRTTNMPTSEIAENMGYQDQNYFYRKFSAMFDITPGKYRALCKEAEQTD